ncbi:ABC-2 type transport system permease protein [Pullulanibacillus pueri]|uniref:ABC transporter permease n=1 Tax=Pullulanibacillus pueri TaxID=1437324 RepID=A0A8J2ZTA3_9BACL|nr:ABC transporter permease subunit [Pullulanibacillus pueri]MBM7681833.1 ABC-2 type transport system permease protein [Pullulanibacillus pueri]GGH76268.1 hypothetical protein GCM10007096_06440 [Pullulanibacillus pueri]
MRGLRLIQNETIKIYKRKVFWIMLIILIAISILWAFIALKTAEDHSHWKQDLQAQNSADSKLEEKADQDMAAITEQKNEMAMNKYRLEHNIKPLYSNTVMGFVDSSTEIASIISIFLVIIGGSIVSQEYSWGTMKMLLIRPIHRWKILLSKFLSVVLIGIAYLMINFIISFIVGLIFFGGDFGSTRFLYEHHNMVQDVSVFFHLLQVYGSHLADIIVITAFAFMISTLFKSNALAIGLSIAIYYGGNLVSVILSAFNEEIPKYIFFLNLGLYDHYVGGGSPLVHTSVTFSACILAVYFILFMLISLLVFEKRDVAE